MLYYHKPLQKIATNVSVALYLFTIIFRNTIIVLSTIIYYSVVQRLSVVVYNCWTHNNALPMLLSVYEDMTSVAFRLLVQQANIWHLLLFDN